MAGTRLIVALSSLTLLAGCGSQADATVHADGWTRTDIDVVAGPVLTDDKAFVVIRSADATTELRALSISDGHELWRAGTTSASGGNSGWTIQPLVDGDLVIAPRETNQDDELVAYDTKTGTVKWTHPFWSVQQPTICGIHRICAPSFDRHGTRTLGVLDAQTGMLEITESDISGRFYWSHSGAGMEADFDKGVIKRRNDSGYGPLWTVDIAKESGVDLSKSSTVNSSYISSTLMVASFRNKDDPKADQSATVGINPTNGTVLWMKPHLFYEGTQDDGKHVLLRNGDATVTSVDAKNGKVAWTLTKKLDWSAVGGKTGDGRALKDEGGTWVVLRDNGKVNPPSRVCPKFG